MGNFWEYLTIELTGLSVKARTETLNYHGVYGWELSSIDTVQGLFRSRTYATFIRPLR